MNPNSYFPNFFDFDENIFTVTGIYRENIKCKICHFKYIGKSCKLWNIENTEDKVCMDCAAATDYTDKVIVSVRPLEFYCSKCGYKWIKEGKTNFICTLKNNISTCSLCYTPEISNNLYFGIYNAFASLPRPNQSKPLDKKKRLE